MHLSIEITCSSVWLCCMYLHVVCYQKVVANRLKKKAKIFDIHMHFCGFSWSFITVIFFLSTWGELHCPHCMHVVFYDIYIELDCRRLWETISCMQGSPAHTRTAPNKNNAIIMTEVHVWVIKSMIISLVPWTWSDETKHLLCTWWA